MVLKLLFANGTNWSNQFINKATVSEMKTIQTSLRCLPNRTNPAPPSIMISLLKGKINSKIEVKIYMKI